MAPKKNANAVPAPTPAPPAPLFRGDHDEEDEDATPPPEGSNRHATDDVVASPPPAERVARDKARTNDDSASGSDTEMGSADAGPSKLPSPTLGLENDEEEEDKYDDPNLLASLPIYLSNSLPATSRLALFQYSTYAKGSPLPVPESAKTRGLSESARWRPKADRVEVELPLDLRGSVYNAERGAEMGQGVAHGGSIGAEDTKVKKESGVTGSSSRKGKEKESTKRLEKTRLESTLVPHQTKYLVGVIRDGALHLTHLDSVQQLRPSMHYLDGLDVLDKAEKKRAAASNGDEDGSGASDEEGGAAPGAAAAKADTAARRKGALQVSVAMGAKGADGKDNIMQAQREAEAESWVELEWMNEETEESQKTLESQLFAASKQPLVCTTKMREFL